MLQGTTTYLYTRLSNCGSGSIRIMFDVCEWQRLKKNGKVRNGEMGIS